MKKPFMLHNWSFSEHRKLCLPRTPKKRMTAITSYNNIMDWVKMAVPSNAGFLELQKQHLIQKSMLMTWSLKSQPCSCHPMTAGADGCSPWSVPTSQPSPVPRGLMTNTNPSHRNWLATTEEGTSISMADTLFQTNTANFWGQFCSSSWD